MWTKNFCISLEELSRKSPLGLYVTAVNCIIQRLQWHMQGEIGNSEAVLETGLPGDWASSFLSSPAFFITMDFHIILLTIFCLVETF